MNEFIQKPDYLGTGDAITIVPPSCILGTGEEEFYRLLDVYKQLCEKRDKESSRIMSGLTAGAKEINEVLKELVEDRIKTTRLNNRFIRIARDIKEYKIEEYLFKEKQYQTCINDLPRLKEKQDVFKCCNYDEYPFWDKIQGSLLKGFDPLRDAQERMNNFIKVCHEAIQKNDSTISNMKNIHEALKNVDQFFKKVLVCYERFLDEFEFAFSMVRCAAYQHDMFYFSNALHNDLHFFPKHHLESLQICDKLARISCRLSKQNYLKSYVSQEEASQSPSDDVSYQNMKPLFTNIGIASLFNGESDESEFVPVQKEILIYEIDQEAIQNKEESEKEFVAEIKNKIDF